MANASEDRRLQMFPELTEAQLRRIIGTREFQKAAVLKLCGESWREIRDRLLEGWTRDEKAKVGV